MCDSEQGAAPLAAPDDRDFDDKGPSTPVTDSLPVTRCLICESPSLVPRFRVAFPDWGPELTAAWPLDVEPPVGHWTIAGCQDCGVHFPNPFPTEEAITTFYARQATHSDWEEIHYVEETEDRSRSWGDLAEKLTRVKGRAGDLLEIGPAGGHLLKAASAQGWDVLGVEAAPKFARIMKERGIPTHEGTLATLETDRQFDAIAMMDVLEHLHDPIGDLQRCAKLLKPDGVILISTCDIGSIAARYYGLRWRQIVISHTFYWTQESLAIALRRAGLEPKQFSSVRWWDPDRRRERLQWGREFAKLLVRQGVQLTWRPLTKRSNAALSFQRRHLALDRWLEFKIGDQAVMSEVVLVVASPLPRQ